VGPDFIKTTSFNKARDYGNVVLQKGQTGGLNALI